MGVIVSHIVSKVINTEEELCEYLTERTQNGTPLEKKLAQAKLSAIVTLRQLNKKTPAQGTLPVVKVVDVASAPTPVSEPVVPALKLKKTFKVRNYGGEKLYKLVGNLIYKEMGDGWFTVKQLAEHLGDRVHGPSLSSTVRTLVSKFPILERDDTGGIYVYKKRFGDMDSALKYFCKSKRDEEERIRALHNVKVVVNDTEFTRFTPTTAPSTYKEASGG